MTDFPTKVKIGWATYAIEEWPTKGAFSAKRFGECSHVEKIIRIDTTHALGQVAETLLHEIMHAVLAVWQLGEGPKEEDYVGNISNGLATVWADNPEIFAWLAENMGVA